MRPSSDTTPVDDGFATSDWFATSDGTPTLVDGRDDIVIDPGPSTPDLGGAEADSAADATLPCLVDADCAHIERTNLCHGPIRCIDYRCQPDPGQNVKCPLPSDPACEKIACDTATGQCVTTIVCTCEPVDNLLCFKKKTFSTADVEGRSAVLSGYTCGPGGGDLGEHVFLFAIAESKTVKVSASVKVGTIGGLYVLAYAAGVCDMSACVAGGSDAVAFAAEGGVKYAIVVEHASGGPVSVELSAQCGLEVELDCGNDVDDDQNGMTDCDDPVCVGTGDCPAALEMNCTDDVDDDDDGLTDCDDSDCDEVLDCLQTCQTSSNAYCGLTQGLGTGGGKDNASQYPCGPVAEAKEVVYEFATQTHTIVNVELTSAVEGMGMYLMRDQGLGCTPKHCEAYHPSMITFAAGPGDTFFVAVDNAAGKTGAFDITFGCTP